MSARIGLEQLSWPSTAGVLDAGSLLWGPGLSVIGCLSAASLLGSRDPPPWRRSELFHCLVSPGRPNPAWLRTTGVDLPLLELEIAVSAKKDMRDKG